MASTGFLSVSLVTSLLSMANTAGSLWTHSVDLWPSFAVPEKRTSCAYWCPKSLLARARLNHSTIYCPRWAPSTPAAPLLTSTLCLVNNCDTLPINSLQGSTCRTLVHFRRWCWYVFMSAVTTSLQSLDVNGSAALYMLATSTTVSGYL